MENCIAPENPTTRRILSSACATVLGVALTTLLSQPALAGHVTPPPVPASIAVKPGFTAFLEGHGVGTQNYICLPAGATFAWKLFTPEATLFSDAGRQVTTHFFSPAPIENAPFLPTWQHSRDTSAVWARLAADPYSQPDFVARGAVPWLLLEVAAAQDGPAGGSTLTAARYIQRLNTFGGVAPSTGCAESADVGRTAFVPYMADYFFFSKDSKDANENN
jgi:Protein of unknown function (DUF3455)